MVHVWSHVTCDLFTVGVLDMRQKLANIVDSSRDMCSSLLHAFNVLSQQEEVDYINSHFCFLV
jgi:hypothetical protein